MSNLSGDKIDMLFTAWNKFLCVQELSVDHCGINDDRATGKFVEALT